MSRKLTFMLHAFHLKIDNVLSNVSKMALLADLSARRIHIFLAVAEARIAKAGPDWQQSPSVSC
jgi:hypothetical protein